LDRLDWYTRLINPNEEKQGKIPTEKPLEILDKIVLALTEVAEMLFLLLQ